MSIENSLTKHTTPYLDCKDYSVSKEKFSLHKNEVYDVLVTQPIPKNLDTYYESEDYISHTDSKRTLFDKVYQFVKNITLKQKLNLINSFNFEEKTLLDVGAGTGDFLNFCKQNHWEVLGTEPNKKARAIAKKKNILLFENLTALESKQFNLITLWHVLEHVKDLEEYIKTLRSLLTEKGRLIIAVPNFKCYDAKYYKEFWAAFDVPRHLWHFSQNGIEQIFKEFGFQLENTKPMKFDSYYVSLLSEKYKTNKMNPINGFYRGFLSNRKAKQTSEYSSLIYVFKKQ